MSVIDEDRVERLRFVVTEENVTIVKKQVPKHGLVTVKQLSSEG